MTTKIESAPIPFDAKDFPNNFQRPRPRIVVVENVYHQSPGSDPVGVDTSSSRFCNSDEQPFLRRTRIGDEWMPLETGWVSEPFLIAIRNDAAAFRVNPSSAEREEAGRRVIEVAVVTENGLGAPFTLIHPGDSVRLYPLDGAKYYLRSQLGYAQVTINAFAG